MADNDPQDRTGVAVSSEGASVQASSQSTRPPGRSGHYGQPIGYGQPKHLGATTGARRVALRDRQKSALDLRRAGATLQQIADQLGYKNASGAQQLILAALKELPREPANELRRIENERLEFMTLALWKQIQDGASGKGDPSDTVAAVGAMVRVMERRARLLGLDAPIKTLVSGEQSKPIVVEQRYDLGKLSTDQLRALDTIMAAAGGSLQGVPEAALGPKASDQEIDVTPEPKKNGVT